MALNGNADGILVAAAVAAAAAGVTPGTPITPTQQETIWKAVFSAHDPYLVANAVVAGTVTSGPGAGGAITGTVS